jgi:hypothetical protein
VKTDELVLLGVGGFLLYQWLAGGLKRATDPVADKIAKIWTGLFDAPPFQVLGNVQLPDGSLVPIASLTVKTDQAGNVYAQTGGHLYQLQPSDSSGNWPAVLVA